MFVRDEVEKVARKKRCMYMARCWHSVDDQHGQNCNVYGIITEEQNGFFWILRNIKIGTMYGRVHVQLHRALDEKI